MGPINPSGRYIPPSSTSRPSDLVHSCHSLYHIIGYFHTGGLHRLDNYNLFLMIILYLIIYNRRFKQEVMIFSWKIMSDNLFIHYASETSVCVLSICNRCTAGPLLPALVYWIYGHFWRDKRELHIRVSTSDGDTLDLSILTHRLYFVFTFSTRMFITRE